jgi:hypothetical protein
VFHRCDSVWSASTTSGTSTPRRWQARRLMRRRARGSCRVTPPRRNQKGARDTGLRADGRENCPPRGPCACSRRFRKAFRSQRRQQTVAGGCDPGENGTNMTHWGKSATREHPPAHPTYSGPARLTTNAFAEVAPSGICSRATHICSRSRPKRFIDEAVLAGSVLAELRHGERNEIAYDALG